MLPSSGSHTSAGWPCKFGLIIFTLPWLKSYEKEIPQTLKSGERFKFHLRKFFFNFVEIGNAKQQQNRADISCFYFLEIEHWRKYHSQFFRVFFQVWNSSILYPVPGSLYPVPCIHKYNCSIYLYPRNCICNIYLTDLDKVRGCSANTVVINFVSLSPFYFSGLFSVATPEGFKIALPVIK